MNEWLHSIQQLFEQGGWLMLPLTLLSIIIYYQLFGLFCILNSPIIKNYQLPDIQPPPHSSLRKSIEFLHQHCFQLREQQTSYISQRIKFLHLIIPISPLIGLLGTVVGILKLFQQLDSLAQTRFELVLTGIYQALITTQAGLLIAIPAYFLLSLLQQKRKKVELELQAKEQLYVNHWIQHQEALS